MTSIITSIWTTVETFGFEFAIAGQSFLDLPPLVAMVGISSPCKRLYHSLGVASLTTYRLAKSPCSLKYAFFWLTALHCKFKFSSLFSLGRCLDCNSYVSNTAAWASLLALTVRQVLYRLTHTMKHVYSAHIRRVSFMKLGDCSSIPQLRKHLATIASDDSRLAIGNSADALYDPYVYLICSIRHRASGVYPSPLLIPWFQILFVLTMLIIRFGHAEKPGVMDLMVHSYSGDDRQVIRPFSPLQNVRGVVRTLAAA